MVCPFSCTCPLQTYLFSGKTHLEQPRGFKAVPQWLVYIKCINKFYCASYGNQVASLRLFQCTLSPPLTLLVNNQLREVMFCSQGSSPGMCPRHLPCPCPAGSRTPSDPAAAAPRCPDRAHRDDAEWDWCC